MRSLEPVVTEGPRADILRLVRRVPGAHLRGIERMTGLPLGQVLYHLDRLERMGLLVSVKDWGFRRYFVAADVDRREKRILGALRHDVPRRVALALLRSPGLAHKDLQAIVGVAGSTLSFHLQRLVASGVLLREREGGALRYRVADADTLQQDLVVYADSFEDPAVHDFVRELAASQQAASAEASEPVVS